MTIQVELVGKESHEFVHELDMALCHSDELEITAESKFVCTLKVDCPRGYPFVIELFLQMKPPRKDDGELDWLDEMQDRQNLIDTLQRRAEELVANWMGDGDHYILETKTCTDGYAGTIRVKMTDAIERKLLEEEKRGNDCERTTDSRTRGSSGGL